MSRPQQGKETPPIVFKDEPRIAKKYLQGTASRVGRPSAHYPVKLEEDGNKK